MLIGIMGRKSLPLIQWLRVMLFTNKKRQDLNSFVYTISLHVAETPKASIKTMSPISHNTFRHCCVRFCWKTFLETAVYRPELRYWLAPGNVKNIESYSHCINN